MCLGIPGQIKEIISADMQLAMVEVGGPEYLAPLQAALARYV